MSLSTIFQLHCEYLYVAGNSMLTLSMLLHWNITPQTNDMIFHPVILYRHWAGQFYRHPLNTEHHVKVQLEGFLMSFVWLSWYLNPQPLVTKRNLYQLSHCASFYQPCLISLCWSIIECITINFQQAVQTLLRLFVCHANLDQSKLQIRGISRYSKILLLRPLENQTTPLITLAWLNKLRCHTHFKLSANQIAWSRLMIQMYILNGKQCRSRSVGFWRSQLIWIYTICKGRVCMGSDQLLPVQKGFFLLFNVQHWPPHKKKTTFRQSQTWS